MIEPTIIQLIADYGVGDPAFSEVIQKLTFLDRSIRVGVTSVPSFSTIATGIWISQFSTVNAYPGLIIYSNTAPRKVFVGHKEQTDGGRLVYSKLDNGVILKSEPLKLRIDVNNQGTGEITPCGDKVALDDRDNVAVTLPQGVECSELGNSNVGQVKLRDGHAVLRCTKNVNNPGPAYEDRFTISLAYDYMQEVVKQVTINKKEI